MNIIEKEQWSITISEAGISVRELNGFWEAILVSASALIHLVTRKDVGHFRKGNTLAFQRTLKEAVHLVSSLSSDFQVKLLKGWVCADYYLAPMCL